jgi:hypothetical protein
MFGDEIYRITGRKDQYGEVDEFICNTCRFDTKDLSQWTIEGPRHIERDSVIGQGHYEVKAEIPGSVNVLNSPSLENMVNNSSTNTINTDN